MIRQRGREKDRQAYKQMKRWIYGQTERDRQKDMQTDEQMDRVRETFRVQASPL